jgi:GntR family transcriptional regulator / MocR family aminotransferase
MGKRTTTLPNLMITVDGNAKEALHRQLYEEMRKAILSSRLTAGTRLPSTRELAHEIGVSRNTVLIAFEQLYSEGYTESRRGSGTYVSRLLPDELLQARSHNTARTQSLPDRRTLSERGKVIAQRGKVIARALQGLNPETTRLPFRIGTPALDAFPCKIWSRLTARHWRHSPEKLLGYGGPAGYRPLREAIATYLRTVRAARCEADQIIIVSGSQQALDLTASVLLDPGEAAWMEEPGYWGARTALLGAGARLVHVPVDAEGMILEDGIRRDANPRLIHVTPSHQYPLGMTMSLSRRLHLLKLASQVGAWILEDDYDSEFRYAGRPLASLQGLDSEGRVVYIGTFSKVLFPSLRLGYIVAPPDLLDGFVSARSLLGQSPLLEQAVITDFIEQGHFARHIRTMRTLYAERQDILIKATKRDLSGLLQVEPSDAGMDLIGWLPEDLKAKDAARAAAQEGVEVIPLSAYHQGANRGALRLGYSGYTPRELRKGVAKLAIALTKLRSSQRRMRLKVPPGILQ